MSKSNLSADAQCFVPSRENKNKEMFLNSYGESFNYYSPMDFSRHLYDVSLCSNYHTNQPYIVPMFSNFYSNDGIQVTQIHTLQTHQDAQEQLESCNKAISHNSRENHCFKKADVLLDEVDVESKRVTRENLCEGKIIVSKSTKKRKAKKNKILKEYGAVKTNLSDKPPDSASQQDLKLTKSWSEVVSHGLETSKSELKVSNGCVKSFKSSPAGLTSENKKKMNKVSTSEISSNELKETDTQNISATWSNSNFSKNDALKDCQHKKIRILNRKEKLDHIEEIIKDPTKRLTERSHSSEPLKVKKKIQTVKPAKFTDKPITLDISEMISLSKKYRDGKTDVSHNFKSQKSQMIKRGPNILDSTSVTKRGKEREKQKAKKPTKLRKVILKDRMFKRSKFLQSLGLLETRSLERLNVEYDLPLVTEDNITRVEFPSRKSALNHLQDVDPRVLSSIHSRRFREYCNQVVSKEINECCMTFLKELVRFQDNQFHKDPAKARIKKRLVFGLREVLKFLGVRKIKCVIITPNVEKIQSEGGLEEKIERIITSCQINNVPFVFALSRRQLGFTCFKKVPVSVVGILNYDGAEIQFRRLKELTESARERYKEMVTKLTEELSILELEDNSGVKCGMMEENMCLDVSSIYHKDEDINEDENQD